MVADPTAYQNGSFLAVVNSRISTFAYRVTVGLILIIFIPLVAWLGAGKLDALERTANDKAAALEKSFADKFSALKERMDAREVWGRAQADALNASVTAIAVTQVKMGDQDRRLDSEERRINSLSDRVQALEHSMRPQR